MTTALDKLTNSSATRVFRRAFIKRRDAITGKFDSDWLEITKEVKRWGKLKTSVDIKNTSKIKFNSLNLVVANNEGAFNDETDPNSIFFGYANQQRNLVKITFGFIEQQKVDGIWYNKKIPSDEIGWDFLAWDIDLEWDEEILTEKAFIGIISGDQMIGDDNQVTLSIMPLVQLFRDYPASKLTGWTTTGWTASKFVEAVRDHTIGGEFIFRPFFDNTTTNWEVSTTTTLYPALNTNTSSEIYDSNIWDVIENLAQAENFIPNIKANGVFYFGPKSSTTTSSYSYYGGYAPFGFDANIKQITKYGKSISNYYSRVQVKFAEEDTYTSYYTKESTIEVAGGNAPWNYGYRTFKLDNPWIANTTVAQSLGDELFEDLSSLKREITFKTSFIPHLDILNVVQITYSSTPLIQESLWNQNDWKSGNQGWDRDTWDSSLNWDETVTDFIGLVWYDGISDNINLQNEEMKLLSIEIDLDKFENTFLARET